MNLSQSWDHYRFHTGKLSDISRQSSYAGIAIIWIFKSIHVSGAIAIPFLLKVAAALIFFTLFFDFLQYLMASIKWWSFSREQDRVVSKKIKDEEISIADEFDFMAPDDINDYPELFFILKSFTIVCSYITIIAYLVGSIL